MHHGDFFFGEGYKRRLKALPQKYENGMNEALMSESIKRFDTCIPNIGNLGLSMKLDFFNDLGFACTRSFMAWELREGGMLKKYNFLELDIVNEIDTNSKMFSFFCSNFANYNFHEIKSNDVDFNNVEKAINVFPGLFLPWFKSKIGVDFKNVDVFLDKQKFFVFTYTTHYLWGLSSINGERVYLNTHRLNFPDRAVYTILHELCHNAMRYYEINQLGADLFETALMISPTRYPKMEVRGTLSECGDCFESEKLNVFIACPKPFCDLVENNHGFF